MAEKISVVIISKNEAAKIADCLESVKWADEIIVVDSGSTDLTREICLKYTELFFEESWEEHGCIRDRFAYWKSSQKNRSPAVLQAL